VDAIMQRQFVEAVPALGAAPTVQQALTAILALLGNKDRVGNTIRYKAADGVTVLMTFTTDDIEDATTHLRTV